MPAPARYGNSRAVHHGGTRWILGSFTLTPPHGGPAQLAGSSFVTLPVARLELTGFSDYLDSSLADAAGVYPILLGSPNVTIDVTPYDHGDGDIDQLFWYGRTGSVNSGCGPGTAYSHEARLRHVNTDSGHGFVVSVYSYARLANGTCRFMRYFLGGSTGLDEIAAGRTIELRQKLGDPKIGDAVLMASPTARCKVTAVAAS